MDPPTDPTNLAGLVLQSKTALHQGEQLGIAVNESSKVSSDLSLEVQLLDARLRWMTDGVLEQLKLASTIAKSLEQRQVALMADMKKWDATKEQHCTSLDKILDSLSLQHVPPEFHQAAIDEAIELFGSQVLDDHSDGEDENPHSSSNGTLRAPRHLDRRKWRTLRDFIDEKSIEEVLEALDEDRLAIDDLIAMRADNPNALMQDISTIQSSISHSLGILPVKELLGQQNEIIHTVAKHLESLAFHYDQLAHAQTVVDSGEQIYPEEMEVFTKDTDELPSILAELAEDLQSVQTIQTTFKLYKQTATTLLASHPDVLDALDGLAETMSSMLQEQDELEREVDAFRNKLQSRLETLDDLCSTYESYKLSFNTLVLELDRRKRWSEEIASEINRMKHLLTEYWDTEVQRREAFMTTYGSSLPDDLCLSISNTPHHFSIVHMPAASFQGGRMQAETIAGQLESIPFIPEDILAEAKANVEKTSLLGT